MLENIRVILVETSHPGNIGAVARAMKNMGLTRLDLVNPRYFPSLEADARASGATDILAKASVFADLSAALAGCRLVIGTSARVRTLDWPLLDPAACAAQVLPEAARGQVALVFGRESAGLTNLELGYCHALLHIPTNPDYSSLNLAMAVQVVLYELRMLALVTEGPLGGPVVRTRTVPEAVPEREALLADDVADVAAMDGFMQHLAQTLQEVGFSEPERSELLMLRLRRLFMRARPDVQELNILRGILSACQGRKSMRR
jgi:tRNA (cytidine32/uridine32-2'-O)-methyltransferase